MDNLQASSDSEKKAPPSADKALVADPKRSKLVKPPRLIKLEILRDCLLNEVVVTQDESGTETQQVLKNVMKIKGDVVFCLEDDARELLNFKVRGTYGFSGERDGKYPLQSLKKARVWVDPSLVKDEFMAQTYSKDEDL